MSAWPGGRFFDDCVGIAERDADAIIEEPTTGPCSHTSESSATEEPLWVAGDIEIEMVLGLVEEK